MELYEKHISKFNEELSLSNLNFYNAPMVRPKDRPDGIIILGMGGSGLAGNILLHLKNANGLKTPVALWKDYGLPKTQFKNPLYVFISFSGNTEETLSGLTELLAARRKVSVAVITTGGALKDIAEKRALPFVSYDSKDLTPRESLGYNYYALIKVLRRWFPEIKALEFSSKLRPYALRSRAQKLAKKLKRKIVLVYTDSANANLAHIFKIILNETGKTAAFSNVVPELDHNEITAFEKNRKQFSVIFLIDKEASPKNLKKIKITERVLNNYGVLYQEFSLTGKNIEEKFWNTVTLAQYVGLYLAKANKADPTATKLIDELKILSKGK